MTRYLDAFGKPTFLLGANYWSRAGGPRMWEATRFDEKALAAEVAQMRRLGMNACRSFFFLPTFMPQPPRVEDQPLERMRRMMEICEKERLAVLPSLLVGHMSGENYDFVGQRGRNAYDDPEIVTWELALARAAARTLSGSPALCAWVLSNEMPLWGGRHDVLTITAWAAKLADELRRSGDPRIPVGTGDGYMNAKGGQNGFEPMTLCQVMDYLGPHAYYSDTDALRQSLYYELLVRSLQPFGKPVLFEEFGCSSQQAGEAGQAALWREVIHTCMSIGGAGALGWCMTDFALPEEPPYRHHAFELEFGATRADGSEKAVCDVLREAGQLVDSLDWPALDFPTPRAAIVRASYHETTYPFSWEERRRMTGSLLQSYVMARKASIEAYVVPETHPLEGFDLIFVPSTQKLLAPTWETLLRRAEQGATVYWSYFGGDYDFHQGMWCHRFEALTGCRHELRYGLPDVPPAEVVISGPGLAIATRTEGGSAFARAFLPLVPQEAQVLARDQAGRPALTRKSLGAGAVYFLAYPLEHYLANQPGINGRDGSHVLYAQLAAAAGIRPDFPSSDGRVQTHTVTTPTGRLVWAINRSWDEVETHVDAPEGSGAYRPKEVRLLRT